MADEKELSVWFNHGCGDCCQFAALLQLYKRRGYNCRVHYEKNKEAVFQAAGIPFWEQASHYHHWRYASNFNHPDPQIEGSGNKTYENLNTERLPDIGERSALWAELAALDLESSFDAIIDESVTADVARFLDGLPRPVVLLHSHGTNWPKKKNIPDDVVSELYRRLLDGMPGSLVLLDWDNRVPTPKHARIRHLKRDWRHASVLELAALMNASDLLIGIDSGPFHLANMTRLPALGVFHAFFPWCVCLPRASGKTAMMTRDSHHHCTTHRRKLWNPIEYPAPMPSAEHIARHALRMLTGARYGLPVGRDAMLQHLVRDCQQPPPGNAAADRGNTLDVVFRELGKLEAPRIVETGCVRSQEDWRAGYFGYLAGVFVDGKKNGAVISVDVDAKNCETARSLLKGWPVEVVEGDSVAFLETRTEPIDCLYLDSMDCEHPEHAEHALREALAGEKLVSENGLIVIDDTAFAAGWTGKGAKAVPWLLSRGWRLIGSGYQCVLQRGAGSASSS